MDELPCRGSNQPWPEVLRSFCTACVSVVSPGGLPGDHPAALERIGKDRMDI